MSDRIVFDYEGREYTQGQLTEAFDRVKDPEYWKNPIDAVVTEDQKNVTVAAVVYFTATVPDVYPIDLGQVNKIFRIKAIGYLLGPAGP